MIFDSTYMLNCGCGAEILIIRKGESSPLEKAPCPACGQVHLVNPKTRREHGAQLERPEIPAQTYSVPEPRKRRVANATRVDWSKY